MPLSSRGRHLVLVFVAAGAVWAARACWAAAALDLMSLLPKSGAVSGWRMQGKPATYTRATLFDYINGGADFYLAYDFRRAAVAGYVGPGSAKITVELYDMGSSYDAFGVFSHERAQQSPPVGQESSYAGGLLTFWKDRLFARVFADRESPALREAVIGLGKTVSTRVPSVGKKPPLLAVLPRDGLASDSVRYLHRETTLNSVLYLPGNPLRLTDKTEAVYGEYGRSGPPAKLLVVRYPDARQAMAGFLELMKLHGASRERSPAPSYIRQTERYRWAGALIHDRYIVVVSQAPDQATARGLLQSARQQVPASGG